MWRWIVQHWSLWGIPTIAVGVAGAIRWFYAARKARADAIAAEIMLRQVQRNSPQEQSTIDEEIVRALADRALWGNGPTTGAGDRIVRVNQIAEFLSLREDVVADGLERLEEQGKVKRHNGTSDNPAPYWSILRRW